VSAHDENPSCTYLVLTGGAGTRLGADKASLLLDGVSLRERQMSALPPGRVHELGVELTGGPASAVIAFLPEVSTELVGLLAVDMPFAAALVQRLAAQWSSSDGYQGLVPVDGEGREQWLCAVYSTAALNAAGNRYRTVGGVRAGVSMTALVGDLDIARVPLLGGDIVMAMDIDTREDLVAVRSVMEQGESYGS
jgi:molybdopterin-guanine dinucleotide biosynthesis protein A